MDQPARVQADQLAVLLLIIRHGGVGEAFEARAEVGFGSAGASGDAAELALVAGEEADDEVGFAEGVGVEDEGFAQASGHGVRLTRVAGWDAGVRSQARRDIRSAASMVDASGGSKDAG